MLRIFNTISDFCKFTIVIRVAFSKLPLLLSANNCNPLFWTDQFQSCYDFKYILSLFKKCSLCWMKCSALQHLSGKCITKIIIYSCFSEFHGKLRSMLYCRIHSPHIKWSQRYLLKCFWGEPSKLQLKGAFYRANSCIVVQSGSIR